MEEQATADNNQTSVPPESISNSTDIVSGIISRINEAENILVALSSNPSVDEMAAAIGLSLFLDKLGKRTTAIYSGTTPNALEFLKPEETFESTTDALQDFVIALNKEKADHLRYKLDGEFVKIFITPYRTRISEEDLEFTYGDFNVDLVLALDVANGVDLDSALREHGRIMHDAAIVNITTGNPGKLGEIEWSDKTASSVSEMIAKLLYSIEDKAKIDPEEATAFLTGIVAATNRFSNANTTSDTMKLASRLMESGANQQLVAKNITSDTENEMFSKLKDAPAKDAEPTENQPATDLNIKHDETITDETKTEPAETETIKPAEPVEPTEPTESTEPAEPVADDTATPEKENTLLNDLKAAEESLSHAGAETTPEIDEEPIKIDSTASEPDLTTITSPAANPATANTPVTPINPEINGVPEINYMPMPGDEVLPPPPTPPIAPVATGPEVTLPTVPTESAPEPTLPTTPEAPATEPVSPIVPATPAVEPTLEPLGAQPAMQDQIYTPQASDPGSFKIPGM